MSATQDIAIIGPGKVGTALGILAHRAGWCIRGVAGGGPGRAEAAAEAIGADGAGEPAEVALSAPLVLLTVPDEAIRRVCEELSAAGAWAENAVVAHCSGALDSELLASSRAAGTSVGSMHPLQTFPSAEAAVERMPGTFFFIEGDERAMETLESFGRAVGARCARIAPGAKPLYHASAVMACNYLVALLDAAVTTAERAGIAAAQATEAMNPIIRATLDNVLKMGTEHALTGPIVRGDVETVRRHLSALAGGASDGFYRAAGLYTVGLAERGGNLPPEKADELRRLLRREKE